MKEDAVTIELTVLTIADAGIGPADASLIPRVIGRLSADGESSVRTAQTTVPFNKTPEEVSAKGLETERFRGQDYPLRRYQLSIFSRNFHDMARKTYDLRQIAARVQRLTTAMPRRGSGQ